MATAFHPFLHQKINEDTEGDYAGRFQTSCAITQPVSDDQKMAWWSADFVDGPQEV